jgi:hypothetical protein
MLITIVVVIITISISIIIQIIIIISIIIILIVIITMRARACASVRGRAGEARPRELAMIACVGGQAGVLGLDKATRTGYGFRTSLGECIQTR